MRVRVVNSKAQAHFDARPGVWTVNVVCPDVFAPVRARSSSSHDNIGVDPSSRLANPIAAWQPHHCQRGPELNKSVGNHTQNAPSELSNSNFSSLHNQGKGRASPSYRRTQVVPAIWEDESQSQPHQHHALQPSWGPPVSPRVQSESLMDADAVTKMPRPLLDIGCSLGASNGSLTTSSGPATGVPRDAGDQETGVIVVEDMT